MMTACNVSPKKAASYYHAEDSMGTLGHWFGQGAATLGLLDRVALQPFKEVLYGDSPGKYFRLRQRQGSYNATPAHGRTVRTMERAATDLTFSPPKSVSIVGLVHGDERVVSAHQSAVTAVLNTIQARHLRTRIRQNGKRLKVPTQNMVAATFLHQTSRNQDPQLHTHCLVMNTTQAADGKWRSMVNTEFFDHHRVALSHQYRQELANNLTVLGHKVVWDSSQSFFELASVHPALISEFSSRRREVLAAASSPSHRARQFAALTTRAPKQHNQLLPLRVAIWQRQANNVFAQLDPPVAVSAAPVEQASPPPLTQVPHGRRKRPYIPLKKSSGRSPFSQRQLRPDEDSLSGGSR